MLEAGRDRAESFILSFTLQLNISTGMFPLVSFSNERLLRLFTVFASRKNIEQQVELIKITLLSKKCIIY